MGITVCANGPGHIAKMATIYIYGKTLKKNVLQICEPWTWYVALGMWGLPCLFK